MLNSITTQIPFTYHSLNLCIDKNATKPDETFTELLTGTRAEYSNYTIKINKNETCKFACEIDLNENNINNFKWLIDNHYYTNFYLDSLLAGRIRIDYDKNKTVISYIVGPAIGYKKNDKYYIYNHFNLYIEINEKEGNFQIVGFGIEPISIKQNSTFNCFNENNNIFNDDLYPGRKYSFFLNQQVDESHIIFTYDVYWIKSNKTFSSRWDRYIRKGKQYHWFGLIFSNILLFIFSFFIIYILSKIINKDVDKYNKNILFNDIIDEYGWKQVCYDVFRKPKHLILFCALIGTGIELLLSLIICLFFNVIGFVKPERRGDLINYMIISLCFMGFFGGYFSTTVYKIFSGNNNWIKNTFITAFLFPVIALLILIIVRILFSLEKSSVGFKISEMEILLFLWICISFPLIFLGSLIAIQRKKNFKFPCKVNTVPRKIRKKPFYLELKYIIWFTGILPFATIIFEFNFLMRYLWRFQIYYLASFISSSAFFAVILSSEMSIIVVYFNLCHGDYHWMWKSFFISASPSISTFAYSIYYFCSLNISRITAIVVYFLLMILISAVIALVCGSMGVILTFTFLYYIYSKVKID